MDKTSVFIT